jgi:adenosylhomocysteinase
MNKKLSCLRKEFFEKISIQNNVHIQFVLIIHIVQDVIELINKINAIGNISLLIPVPYSLDPIALKKLKEYPTLFPSLEELVDEKYLMSAMQQYLSKDKPIIIIEIGGYFAKILPLLKGKYNILGAVEDTEFGHRQYQSVEKTLFFPVFSVARSSLKATEDALIGKSCIFSVERILRLEGHILNAQTALVIGYGKIGSSIAKILKQRQVNVIVYDIDPIKRLLALSDGYAIPDKKFSLKKADLIFGATGNNPILTKEYYQLKNNVMLISCSSKQVEFNIPLLNKSFSHKKVNYHLDCYLFKEKVIYVMNEGFPVNFSGEKSLVGAVIALVQAEILVCIQHIIAKRNSPKIHTVSDKIKKELAAQWLKFFCCKESGTYEI